MLGDTDWEYSPQLVQVEGFGMNMAVPTFNIATRVPTPVKILGADGAQPLLEAMRHPAQIIIGQFDSESGRRGSSLRGYYSTEHAKASEDLGPKLT